MEEVILFFLLAYPVMFILILMIYGKKAIKHIRKGDRVVRVKQRIFEGIQKRMLYIYVFVAILFLLWGTAEVYKGNYHFIPIGFGMPVNLAVILLLPVDFDIYTCGIQRGAVFISWKDAKIIEWRDGILTVKTGKGIFGRALSMADKNGEIKRVIEELVSQNICS